MIDREPEELWMEVSNFVQEVVTSGKREGRGSKT